MKRASAFDVLKLFSKLWNEYFCFFIYYQMGLLGQAADMYKLQKEAKRIKKELSQIHVFAESNGVKVTVNGEQEVISVEINDAVVTDPRKIEKSVLEAANRAMKKAQQVAAEKMKAVMGGFPGLGA
jgi:DNA-binding YbaB/EbfC family protein